MLSNSGILSGAFSMDVTGRWGSGSGTKDYIPVWTGENSLGNSYLFQHIATRQSGDLYDYIVANTGINIRSDGGLAVTGNYLNSYPNDIIIRSFLNKAMIQSTGQMSDGRYYDLMINPDYNNYGKSNTIINLHDGNVGIGIESIEPFYKLKVLGNVNIVGNNRQAVFRVGLGTGDAGLVYREASGDLFIGGDNTQDGNIFVKDKSGNTKISLNSDTTGSVINGGLKLPTVGVGASGMDYVCINFNGVLSRSNNPCA